MTVPGRSELQRAHDWATALAAVLDDTAREVGELARRLTAGWPDDHGRQWGERLLALRSALDRDADAAVRVAGQAERLADESTGLPPGPRLGGTAARRADDERGVRLPRLGDREGDGESARDAPHADG